MSHAKDTYHILLVEDDLGDAGLVKIALRRGVYPITLHHVKSGAEAMAFVRRTAAHHAHAPRPDLILLDLNLPGRSGHEILADLKGDEELRGIPVVVLSTSGAERDVVKAYQLGANSFVSKPMDIDEFTRAIHAMQDYWFRLVRLPPP